MTSRVHLELNKLPKMTLSEVSELGASSTVLDHAYSCIKSADIVGYRIHNLSTITRTVTLSAYIHSSRKGRIYYLAGGDLVLNPEGTIQKYLFKCPCKAVHTCFRKVVLFLLAVFFQSHWFREGYDHHGWECQGWSLVDRFSLKLQWCPQSCLRKLKKQRILEVYFVNLPSREELETRSSVRWKTLALGLPRFWKPRVGPLLFNGSTLRSILSRLVHLSILLVSSKRILLRQIFI